jgi:hypothetical protein
MAGLFVRWSDWRLLPQAFANYSHDILSVLDHYTLYWAALGFFLLVNIIGHTCCTGIESGKLIQLILTSAK